MQRITIAELAFWCSNAFTHSLHDVRRKSKREQDGDEIGNSEWLDPAQWLDWKDQVTHTRPLIIYCAYGHEISQGMAAALRAMGADARYLEGGIDAWRAAGHPTQAIGATTP